MKGNDWKDAMKRQMQRLGRFKYPLLILGLGLVLLAIPAKEEARPSHPRSRWRLRSRKGSVKSWKRWRQS